MNKLIINTSKQLSYIVENALVMQGIVMLIRISKVDINICSIFYCEYRAAGALELEIKSLCYHTFSSLMRQFRQLKQTC